MIEIEGMGDLSLSLENLAAMPPDVIGNMLKAAGKVVADAQKKKLAEMGAVDTGKLAASIKPGRPNVKAGTIEIKPTGSRTRYNTTTSNAVIGYFVEYGNNHQQPKPLSREANAECEGEASDAAAEVFDDFLNKIGF